MLFPLIKDFHYIITNFLQRIYISSTSLGDYYSNWKLNSLSHILPNFPSSETIDKDNPVLFIFKTMIFFLLKIQDFIVYFFSFKWLALADFAYLNVSVPENFWKSLPKIPPSYEYSNWIFLMFQKGTRFLDMLEETIGYTLLSKIPKDPFFYEDYNYIKYPLNMDKTNMVFFDSYQTISNLPKTLLEPSWFDSISTPMQIFGLPGVEYDQFHKTANEYGFFNMQASNFGFLGFFLIPMVSSIFFSSFFNSFFINFPLSISRIVSLRYFNVNSPYYDSNLRQSSSFSSQMSSKKNFIKGNTIENFIKISMLSVFGIVFGEISFIFLLILPPPFIQLTLSYLDSIWPYLFGLGLVVLVISEGVKTNLITLWTNVETMNVSLNIKRKPLKVFLLCFLLSLTEQSCCFSYFGSLNFNSTANFFDTYLFSASASPIIFLFSCLGFFIGSVLAITIYNFCLSQLLYFLFLGWKQKKTILSFLFPRYTSFRSTIIKRFYSPGLNFKTLFPRSISTVSDSFYFLLQNYKRIQPVSRFLNFFSVINSYFFNLVILLINKMTHKAGMPVNKFHNNSLTARSALTGLSQQDQSRRLDFSNYPPFFPSDLSRTFSGTVKNQQTFSYKIKNFSSILKQNKPFNWSILTGIDQFLVICLVIFSFTTIPFYSMDFMVNKFFGFIPQDQILNNYNLSNALPDYGDNIGVQVDIRFLDSPNQAETIYCLLHELALFDQNNYGNVLWKTNFENLNYRNALHFSSFLQEYNNQKTRKKFFAPTMRKLRNKLFPYYQGLKDNSVKYGGLTKNSELMQQKKNLFLVDPKDFLNDNLRKKNIKNFEEAFSVISNKVLNSDPDGFSRWSRYWGPRKIIDDPIQYTSDVTFCPLTFDEFGKEIVSGKNIDVEELKKPFAYKYFHNPISKTILSNDLKNFLKHQPLSQQLTDVQEKDLALLRVKMAHYYDSLRFYFNFKNHVHQLKNSFEQNTQQGTDSKKTKENDVTNNSIVKKSDKADLFSNSEKNKKTALYPNSSNIPFSLKQDNQRTDLFYKNLQFPPIIAKSISSLNYHQQFKGTYEVVRELYDVSLYNNNKKNNNIFPEQTPPSENFFEGYLSLIENKRERRESYEENAESNMTANEQKRKKGEEEFEKERSRNFALPIQNFDKQASSKSFKSVEDKISHIQEKKNSNSNKPFRHVGFKNFKDFDFRLGKIKEATLGVTDSVFSRIKNRLYQIDPDLVTNSTKNFLSSNGWLADRKALLSYDKSLFNEYDYNQDHFLHEEAKIINSKDDLSSTVPPFRLSDGKAFDSLSTQQTKKISDSNKSFDQQSIKDFIKMNKKVKESTNPFYVGWDKKLRKFILTSRIIHRPYYLTLASRSPSGSVSVPKNLSGTETDNGAVARQFIHGKSEEIRENGQSGELKPNLNQKDFSLSSKPQIAEYYSSWPFMGEKLTSFKSNKYSGLYTNRRFISDNPKNKPGKNLQTYYYENFPYVEILPYDLIQDYTELFDYYYYKNYNSIKQIFPRLYMPSNLLKFYSRGTNYKQTMLSPTSSTFLWSGTEDISSNYPIALLVNIEQKLLGYETLYLDQKIQERQKYRIDHLKNNEGINFNSNKKNYFFGDNIKMFKKTFRSNFPKTWYKVLDYQNHITRNFEINEEVEELFWYNYQHIISYNRALFFTEHLYPQEIEEDFFVIPNNKYPEKLRYTLGEIRTIQQGYDDGIEYSDDYEIPAKIEKTPKPDTKNY